MLSCCPPLGKMSASLMLTKGALVILQSGSRKGPTSEEGAVTSSTCAQQSAGR